MSPAVQDLNCPNCGAPNEVSPGSNTVTCAHCGTQIYLPQDLSSQPPAPATTPTTGWDEQTKKRVLRWVWWGLGIFLAVMIIPPLCTLVITVCVTLFTVFATLPR